MNRFYTDDEIIDQGAYGIKIFKFSSVFDPYFVFELELYQRDISEGLPSFRYFRIGKHAAHGFVYVFQTQQKMNDYLERYPYFKKYINESQKISEHANNESETDWIGQWWN